MEKATEAKVIKAFLELELHFYVYWNITEQAPGRKCSVRFDKSILVGVKISFGVGLAVISIEFTRRGLHTALL